MTGEAKDFRRRLSDWFRRTGKDYPWRRTEDPYAILVSEIMLQQTQIATVLGPKRYYANWMKRFPTTAALAAASEEAVLKAWEGLGYYSRARNLQRAARVVEEEMGGKFPATTAEIRKLPGVGDYTAGAVASFAYDLPEPLVDANVARVLARLYDYRERIDEGAGKESLWNWARELLEGARAGRVYNSALMELGQRICTPGLPDCGECPVGRFCRAERPENLPVKKPRVKTVAVEEHAVYSEKKGAVLLAQEASGRRREGFWRLPERGEEAVRELPMLLEMKYSITKYRVTLRVYRGEKIRAGAGEKWIAREEVASLPMGSPYRRAMERISAGGVDFQARLL